MFLHDNLTNLILNNRSFTNLKKILFSDFIYLFIYITYFIDIIIFGSKVINFL